MESGSGENKNNSAADWGMLPKGPALREETAPPSWAAKEPNPQPMEGRRRASRRFSAAVHGNSHRGCCKAIASDTLLLFPPIGNASPNPLSPRRPPQEVPQTDKEKVFSTSSTRPIEQFWILRGATGLSQSERAETEQHL